MSNSTQEAPIRISIIGPEPPPIGGTTVLFRSLVEALEGAPDITVEVVNTVGVRGCGATGPFRVVGLVWRILVRILWSDVVALHVSTTAVHVLGPLVAGMAKMSSTPLIIRKFGGTDVLDYSLPRRALWTLRRSDVYLVETRHLVERAKVGGLPQVQWYPNSRPMPVLANGQHGADRRCRRFIFLGQIRIEKGIRELVEAAQGLPDGLTVDLYGPLGFDVSLAELSDVRQLSYRGTVEPQDVHNLLLSYDVLVLPSYREGYPGAVLEAYAAGLPVVVARWAGVQELVDDSTGVLAEPRDAGALRCAMLSLVEDEELYARLCEGVRARRAFKVRRSCASGRRGHPRCRDLRARCATSLTEAADGKQGVSVRAAGVLRGSDGRADNGRVSSRAGSCVAAC